jgi:hypothetical protein
MAKRSNNRRDKCAQRTTNDAFALQKQFDAVLSEIRKPANIALRHIEKQLRRKKVRLRNDERKRLKAACTRLVEKHDESAFQNLFKRQRPIQLDVSEGLDETLKEIESDLERVVLETTDAASRKLTSIFRSWADDNATALEHECAKMRARLARTWGRPLRLFARLRFACAHIGVLTLEHLREEKAMEGNNLANALALLHARACLLASEIESLIRTGFADGATARWRTLHETAVTATFLLEHGEETATRYLAHFFAEHARGARAYETHRERLGYPGLDAEVVADIEQRVAHLKETYGKEFLKDYGWAAAALQASHGTFTALEEAVKLDFLRPFVTLANEQVHASARGSVMRAGLPDPTPWGAQLLLGPSNYGFADPAQNAAQSLLIATLAFMQVQPVVDAIVLAKIAANWFLQVQQSFVDVQFGIEQREARYSARRKGKNGTQVKRKGAGRRRSARP